MSRLAATLRRSCTFLAWLALCGALVACDGTQPERTRPTVADPLWAEFISAHSAGVVSRTAPIRIVFATEVATPSQVGGDAPDLLLSVEPAVAGVAAFSSPRELRFTPDAPLPPGQHYRISLRPQGLRGVPATLTPFEFEVQVRRPEFEVTLEGLTIDPADAGKMVLHGVVAISDLARESDVERLLQARYAGEPVSIEWRHAPAERRHAFSIAGLQRSAREQSLQLRWDGKPIGADARGERAIVVPARERFLVTQVTATGVEGERHIRVYFSEALDPRQDFRGLVRLSQGEPQVRVDGAVLQVFPVGAEGDELTLTLEPGLRNAAGERLGALAQYPVAFASAKPQIKFTGAGVILPEAPVLAVPFEAVNVRSVRVTAFRVFEDNLPQFLQVNALGGSYELGRVGRHLWRKTIVLDAADLTRWNRFNLDLTELMKQHPGGMIRLSLAIGRDDSLYKCPEQPAAQPEAPLANQDADDLGEASNWDYVEEWYGLNDGSDWTDRDNPCKDAYYAYGPQTKAARNFLVSNIGLLAKNDQRGRWIVAATDLRSAQSLAGVSLRALNFQMQPLAEAVTDERGFAEFTLQEAPFAIVAAKGAEQSWLKVQPGAALPISHFDVGGEQVRAGLKGHLYGERGVWRPGDDIHLTFVVFDKEGTLPAQHPVALELFNPQAQLTQTQVNTSPVNGFYTFKLKTAENAPTGAWTAKATLGGATFSRTLKIETVMPNRLKVALDLEQDAAGALLTFAEGCRADAPCASPPVVRGSLSSQWLSGALAAGLAADVKLRLTPAPTRFERFADFVFDDPARVFASEPQPVFGGTLDAQGEARIERRLDPIEGAPGMLNASLTTRVFERGGAFSVNHANYRFSPYSRYVGLKLPKGDAARDMLRTDERHTVQLATLSATGEPTAAGKVEVTLYKIDWKWWWDKSGESLAQYAQRTHASVVQQSTVNMEDGAADWTFEIKYPAWGRYLIRACDLEGGHCTGRTFYIDWPMWAGRAQDQSGPAANVLVFSADKERYVVGDIATIQLPEAQEGRALFTIESGASILEARWIDLARDSNRITLPITAAMAPNVYASVTLVQPHSRANDRPLRLYGVIPLHVADPATALKPALGVANEWRPNASGVIEVSERAGRAMTYTLAVVDEGLLDLTSFKTPNLHDEFYKREALGVGTWDLFDEVAGAYSAELERLLALGGSDGGPIKNPDERRTRFPPVVRFLGPFELPAGARRRHEVTLPQYIGAVRVMLVGGARGAYGSAEASVFVRQPLMILPTLPRVLGPDEEVAVPVSVFVADPAIKQVTLAMSADSAFEIVGAGSTTLQFARPEEQLAMLRLRSKGRPGGGRIRFVASSGAHRAVSDIDLEVRSPNPPTTRRVQRVLQAGETWSFEFTPHGVPGTNATTLEVSAAPPMNLERRLAYLIAYPYGCLEQTTSAVFPQLYLSSLMKLEDARQAEIQRNVQDGIHRLSGFQTPNGGFLYWPGGAFAPDAQLRNTWSTSYAGHFLLEAKKLGYGVPEAMLTNWKRYQRSTAQAFSAPGESESLDQAYRLFTLALAGDPEVGSMNRLRERVLPTPARWLLAASYKLAGLADVADALVRNTPRASRAYSGAEQIFGAALRDDAITLLALVVLGRSEAAGVVAQDVSRSLSSDDWHSTQSTAYALMAMAHYVGLGEFAAFTFEHEVDGERQAVTVSAPLYGAALEKVRDAPAALRIANTSARRLFATVTSRGVAPPGADEAGAQGLALSIEHRDDGGAPIDVARVPQGTDLVVQLVVTNQSHHRIDNIALAQLVPAGWEIHNERMEGAAMSGEREGGAPHPWWWDAARAADAEHIDVRDDRIYRHFSLKPQERITFITRINAAYRGRFYLPGVAVEAMYDASRFARTKGQWVEVVAQ